MKIISVLFVILIPSVAIKEYKEDISQLLDNPDLILELVKRLGSDKASFSSQKNAFPVPDKHFHSGGDHYVPIVHGDSHSCRTRLYVNTIIKTKDSQKAGATFLGSEDNVDTNAKCLQKCCSTKGCDLAVYENKTKHNCYLFKCLDNKTGNSSCKFDAHADYLSTIVSSISDDTASIKGNKAGSDEDSLKEDLEKVTQENKPVQTDPIPTPRPTQLPHSVALGRWCQLDVSCEDPHAVCFEKTCQCLHSYYQKNGICRKVCLKDQVECKIRGTARIGPDCISEAQVCDGTTQCADGSDERNCKPASVVDKQPQAWQRNSRPRLPVGDKDHDGTGYGYNLQTSDFQHDGSASRENKEETDETNSKTAGMEPPDKLDSAYSKNRDKSLNYEDYSSDIDKELEAVTVTQTQHPHVKPTFHPTKPVVSWYGNDKDQDNKIQGGGQRVHRVDTTVDESSGKGSDAQSENPSEQVQSPRGDRPEALPRPAQKTATKITHTSQLSKPKVKPSQTYPKGSLQNKPSSVDSGSKDRNNNADSTIGYQTFNRPFSPQSMGRQPSRTQKMKPPSDVSPKDYDSNLFSLGQQRPYPMRRPNQPSWAKGNYHKYPDNSFNHPYLGGYNYDYSDYDPYFQGQGQDYNRQYGSRDNSRYPLNSYSGGYPDGNPNPGYSPQQDNWDEKPNFPQDGVASSPSDKTKTENEDQTKSSGDKIDSSTNDKAPSVPLTKGERLNKPTPGEDTDNKQVSSEKTDEQFANKNSNSPDEHDENPDKDTPDSGEKIKVAKTDKTAISGKGKSSESVPVEVKTTPIPGKHPKVEVVDQEEVFVTKEKVIVTSPTDGEQGPIVALSLGLAITLMLLVFVGCRLRNVRHRLRKGRPLHSNEADYLINGMYL